jgi:hypothetical protein
MWRHAIVRELAAILVIKLIGLYAIWFAFFNQPDERELTHHEIGQLLLGKPAADSSHGVTPPSQPTQHTGERDGH